MARVRESAIGDLSGLINLGLHPNETAEVAHRLTTLLAELQWLESLELTGVPEVLVFSDEAADASE